ncbi:MAG: phosphoribosyl-ATP diphosphatase [Anaerovoracaceae bacterium]|jgi:phosphoribosyl-ATP pyrophosphohydrolase
MKDALESLYQVIAMRKGEPMEGSYTSYLFEKGLDKILKKCGEECSETIIAAKNQDAEELKNEICDLIYHIMVLMVNCNIGLEEIEDILNQRSTKIGNLKKIKNTDLDT